MIRKQPVSFKTCVCFCDLKLRENFFKFAFEATNNILFFLNNTFLKIVNSIMADEWKFKKIYILLVLSSLFFNVNLNGFY